MLGLKPRQKALIREVLLMCNNEPWVYARSILPFSSLQGSLRFLRKLKNSALGALLFKDPKLTRSCFEIAKIELPEHLLPEAKVRLLYNRRSLFHLHQQPLLVTETFLPACKLNLLQSSTRQLSMHGKNGL